MTKLIIFGLIIILTCSCAGLTSKKIINGNGNRITINRSTTDYDAISLSDWFNVELVDGKEGKLTLKGEGNLLKHIITDIRNGELYLGVEQGYQLEPSSLKEGIQVIVPVERINSIAMSGSGNIVSKITLRSQDFNMRMSGSGDITMDLEVETLSAAMSGSGDMNLSGRARSFEASTSGSCNIKAYDLETDNVGATLSGSGTLKFTARKNIKARISGSGNISYRGNPEKVDAKISGSGIISKE